MIKQAVFDYLDHLSAGIYSGWGLTDAVNHITERRTYPSTILGYCKLYAELSGGSFICVDRKTSQWEFIPGVKIAGAYLD